MATDSPKQKTYKTLADLRTAAVDHHKAGDISTAQDLYRAYLAQRPKDAAIWSNLGVMFRAQKNFQMAALCQRRAYAITPDAEIVLNNAANALFDAGEPQAALDIRRKAIELSPDSADNWSGLGKYLRAVGQHEEAKSVLQKAIATHPDEPELHIQLSFALLALGDYPNGFAEFKWRWQGDEISLPQMDFPQWKGEGINGKVILVTPEQGFGDTILMARFLRGLRDLGATVCLNVKPPLQRVFEGLDGVDRFVTSKADLKDCDFWSPMMDLPLYLGTTLETVPAPTKLAIPADSVSRARAITAPFADCFKVGVLWSGSVTYRANHKRSFSHTRFLQIADIPDMQLFSLYKGPLTGAFHADGTSCLIIDAASNDRDFADSAALIDELDLVITMDSAIAHVSGSLGANVWNLLHSEAYWLYEPFPDHTPWYPSMRLVRQGESGDWDTVFQTLRSDIEELVKQKHA